MPSLVGSEMCIRDSCYDKGIGIDKNLEKALELIQKAADLGLAQAQYTIATGYESGRWVHENIEKAKYYYQLAANQGLEEAKKRFCLLYTSDAADDMQCVDLGGRRIIKKKKKRQIHQTKQMQRLKQTQLSNLEQAHTATSRSHMHHVYST
eukprot:TRINITY_DN23599_c0_g1_i2.p2 TRINITY_DN23599_c0_g1~~TRINITY_DN23599_c0_g1_i2.p2  ORF type:complete len:151 (+),score=20.28 TRINITY_DN23599_c0_g1_i2:114-566(+)